MLSTGRYILRPWLYSVLDVILAVADWVRKMIYNLASVDNSSIILIYNIESNFILMLDCKLLVPCRERIQVRTRGHSAPE